MGTSFWVRGSTTIDILRRFHMEDYRLMSALVTTNQKKMSASESELVCPTLHHQLIAFVMYLVNAVYTRHLFFYKHSKSVHDGAYESALGCNKTHLDVLTRQCGLWIELCQGRWSQIGWLYELRLRNAVWVNHTFKGGVIRMSDSY